MGRKPGCPHCLQLRSQSAVLPLRNRNLMHSRSISPWPEKPQGVVILISVSENTVYLWFKFTIAMLTGDLHVFIYILYTLEAGQQNGTVSVKTITFFLKMTHFHLTQLLFCFILHSMLDPKKPHGNSLTTQSFPSLIPPSGTWSSFSGSNNFSLFLNF